MNSTTSALIGLIALLFPHARIFAKCAECGEVSRQDWGATSNKPLVKMAVPVDLVVIQHTVSKSCESETDCAQSARDIQKAHVDLRHYDDIAQSFLVGGDGKVYEGRGWDHVGAHTFRYNNKSLGISFVGDFRNQLPTESVLTALKDFLLCGVEKGFLTQNYRLAGHRQLSATESPGEMLYEQIKTWPHWYNQQL